MWPAEPEFGQLDGGNFIFFQYLLWYTRIASGLYRTGNSNIAFPCALMVKFKAGFEKGVISVQGHHLLSISNNNIAFPCCLEVLFITGFKKG